MAEDAPFADRPFDARELRQVLGAFVTGVTVITTVDADGKPHGMTANSFSSVSLDPPLVLWSQSLTTPSHPVFRDAERFAVNILAEDQVEVSNRFARGGIDKFAGCTVRPGLGGVPLIDGCAAHLQCRKVDSYPGGDHVVFIGEVEHIERHRRPPLVFGGGRYLVAQPHDMGLAQSKAKSPSFARLHAVRLATRAIAELSHELNETLGLGVWGNHGPTIVHWEESSHPGTDNLRTGLVLPVLTSATGLAYAAWLPRESTAALIDAELEQQSAGDALSDGESLAQRFEQIRAAGMVRLVGTDRFADLYGASISAVSIPVFDNDGAMVLALTAIGASDRLDTSDEGKLVSLLRRCAADLTGRLKAAHPSVPRGA